MLPDIWRRSDWATGPQAMMHICLEQSGLSSPPSTEYLNALVKWILDEEISGTAPLQIGLKDIVGYMPHELSVISILYSAFLSTHPSNLFLSLFIFPERKPYLHLPDGYTRYTIRYENDYVCWYALTEAKCRTIKAGYEHRLDYSVITRNLLS